MSYGTLIHIILHVVRLTDDPLREDIIHCTLKNMNWHSILYHVIVAAQHRCTSYKRLRPDVLHIRLDQSNSFWRRLIYTMSKVVFFFTPSSTQWCVCSAKGRSVVVPEAGHLFSFLFPYHRGPIRECFTQIRCVFASITGFERGGCNIYLIGLWFAPNNSRK